MRFINVEIEHNEKVQVGGVVPLLIALAALVALGVLIWKGWKND